MEMDPQAGDDIISAALKVLCTPDPHDKAARTEAIVRLWDDGSITMPPPGTAYTVPDRPARESGKVQLVAARDVPKRGKGGSLASRQAMLHALVHIESSAVDLAWDCLARFGAADVAGAGYQLPRQFYSDFIAVAADECRHFRLLEQRLEATGSHYGAMAAHDGLWESAAATAGSLAARLAVEHCTHEARGLDVLPQTIHRFRSNGDAASADLLQNVIYAEEISHCAAGVRWLKHLHRLAHDHDWEQQQAQQQQAAGSQQQQAGSGQAREEQQAASAIPEWAVEARRFPSVELWFHSLIRRHFRGPLKPPFNDAARAQAGFGPEWYLPLAADAEDSAAASAAADSSGHACKGQQQGPAHTAAVACLERCNMTARHM
ncbi:hypothetical protein CHLNCDRAFT_34378 [Chlorella variabilis]|uniref:DUF455 domain-containing protein n=1 Tax=Chlorella variabilis TaxID=554065 RepID=E1Z7V4_CHLVA|nr:hypothetical protein CHLNCDRAFT_34378 [Chlorella variabilis]EFN58237.1 hypothetical protein CHLNCDRAFT_34378 [Chlorella variabilis]|eukprot:XP_005850339.1 hypothetical protein CHLNCDRAFT_34378 [Chlorella variabilis]